MEEPMCRCCKIHITSYYTPWHTPLNQASYNSLSNYVNQMCDSIIIAVKTIILRILELSIQNNPWGRNFSWSCLGQGSVSAGNSGGILSAGLEKWERENEMMYQFMDCSGSFFFCPAKVFRFWKYLCRFAGFSSLHSHNSELYFWGLNKSPQFTADLSYVRKITASTDLTGAKGQPTVLWSLCFTEGMFLKKGTTTIVRILPGLVWEPSSAVPRSPSIL